VTRAAIGIGSNVGDRMAHLAAAVDALGRRTRLLAVSPIFETAPLGVTSQRAFFNAVATVETSEGPEELLEVLFDVERERGRTRRERWGPRTLDLDLLLYGRARWSSPSLTVPHPRMTERRFVLDPLLLVWPGAELPDGTPVEALLPAVAGQQVRPVTGAWAGDRWMDSMERATAPVPVDGAPDHARYRAGPGRDWVNTLGVVFGGIPAAVAVRAAARTVPELPPVAFSYGFLRPVDAGDTIEIEAVVERRTRRDASVAVTLRSSDRQVLGSGRVRLGDRRDGPAAPRPMPEVLGRRDCRTLEELLSTTGVDPGPTVRNWTVMERWDLPSLDPGVPGGPFRAWAQAAAFSNDDPGLSAAALVFPLDALGWPASYLAMGALGRRGMPATPTIEVAGTFHDLASRSSWHLGESTHLGTGNGRTAAAVTVWSEAGAELASGIATMVFVPR